MDRQALVQLQKVGRYYVRGDAMAARGCTNADKERYGVFDRRKSHFIKWFNETDYASREDARSAAGAHAAAIDV